MLATLDRRPTQETILAAHAKKRTFLLAYCQLVWVSGKAPSDPCRSDGLALPKPDTTHILFTMSEQNLKKLNWLLANLRDTTLVTSRWLREHGYAGNLVARYVASGWLVSPARGVYQRAGGALRWQGVLNTLQSMEGLAVHVGGRFALAVQGHEHFLRLGEPATVSLYGAVKLPAGLAS